MQKPQQLHRRAQLAALLLVILSFNLAPAQVVGPVEMASADPVSAPVAPAGNESAVPPPTGSAKAPVAAETPPGVAPTKLPTIVVTAATRTPQPPETTATTTTVLTHQDLDEQKYASVTDALRSVAGVDVVTSGMPGSQTSVFIHGLDSNMTLITVDGRRQAVGLSGADDDLTNLTLDNVDQIEVVRTPVTSAQGGGSTGGVINLVTLSGKGLATPQSSISEEMGSFNTYRENAQSRGAFGNFDYAVSASRQDSIYPALSPGGELFYPGGPAYPGFAGNKDQYRNTTYRGNFGYQVTPAVYVDLHTAYSNAYTSEPNQYFSPDPNASLLIEDWSLSPEITAQFTSFYTSKFYYTHDQQRQANNDPYQTYLALYGPDGPYSPAGYQGRLQINTDSIDWQNDLKLARNWTLTAGIQGDDIDFYENDNNLGPQLFNGRDNNLGGYITSQWQPVEGLNVLNSVRYDSYSLFGGALSWREGASYRVAPTQTVIHASGSSSFTPPSIADLYYPGGSNPNLKPESSLGWEAGVAQPLWDGKVTPGITYFHNDITNYIQFVYNPANFSYLPYNVGHATTDGVEVNVEVKPVEQVSLDLNYTYLDAVDDINHVRLLRRPRNSFNFTGTWNPIAPLTLTVGGNWVVDQQDYDPISGNPHLTEPDYFVLRAGANYRINDTVTIWVRGENLTDQNYQQAIGYYSPSIAGYGGIKISF
jgi:vitamin B12 transporter